MCKSFNIYIANGRLGSDKFLGGKTCKASTVVDYALLSPLLFTLVNNFEILPLILCSVMCILIYIFHFPVTLIVQLI